MTKKVHALPPAVRDAQKLANEVFDGLAETDNNHAENANVIKHTAQVFAIASKILLKIVEEKKASHHTLGNKMSIFEALGYHKDHRKVTKVTQLVKHFDEVSEIHKNKTWLGQIKKDGVCSITTIISGVVRIFSRTGREFTNTRYIKFDISQLNMPDGVYMGELCCSFVSLEVLSGIVNPNRVNPVPKDFLYVPGMLEMYWFDRVNLESFIVGKCNEEYVGRHTLLSQDLMYAPTSFPRIEVLSCKLLCGDKDIEDFKNDAIEQGEEGIIVRDPKADWEAGHKGWRVMKKVRGVDYDLRCIGFEEGTGKYTGKVANLIFHWKDGLTIKAMLGKGWTHQMASDMYLDTSTPNTPIGKIFQVYALEESSKGKLRLPKVGELRFDKDHSDV